MIGLRSCRDDRGKDGGLRGLGKSKWKSQSEMRCTSEACADV